MMMETAVGNILPPPGICYNATHNNSKNDGMPVLDPTIYPSPQRTQTFARYINTPGLTLDDVSKKYASLHHELRAPTLGISFMVVFAYVVLLVTGFLSEILRPNKATARFKKIIFGNREDERYQNFMDTFESIFTRWIYSRCVDVFNRPYTNTPGRKITLLERNRVPYDTKFVLTGNTSECINLGSYNYLGFSQNSGHVTDSVIEAVRKNGITICSPSAYSGYTSLLVETEKNISAFVGAEDSIIISTGFATNSTIIPVLVGHGCLVISDELNHSSIVFGIGLSGAKTRVFPHRNMHVLENILREEISRGQQLDHQPNKYVPWKKIILIVEGLYSMEGTICALPEIVFLKKKYKFYLYIDEAHSFGALGPNARGVCDYYGIHPDLVDVHMGTFTKSFGSVGGFISGKKLLINKLRLYSHSPLYGETISIPCLQQINYSLLITRGLIHKEEGRARIHALIRNTTYFTSRLRSEGFVIYGDQGSPVVPLLIYYPAKLSAFSREMLSRNIAVVVVGHPATSLLLSRVRLCLSSSHTIEDLDEVINTISEIGDLLHLKYLK